MAIRDADFTAEEYRTAAKVFAEEFGEQWVINFLKERADLASDREHYLHRLGMVGHKDSALVRGTKLLRTLRNDGWTPPENLSNLPWFR